MNNKTTSNKKLFTMVLITNNFLNNENIKNMKSKSNNINILYFNNLDKFRNELKILVEIYNGNTKFNKDNYPIESIEYCIEGFISSLLRINK